MCNVELSIKAFEGTIDTVGETVLQEMLIYFPIDEISNISILNYESVRIAISLMKKLSKSYMFYKNTDVMKCCWEFTMKNLLFLENVNADNILLNLLELLKCFTSKMKKLNEFILYLRQERERVLDILADVVNFNIFKKNHAPLCTDVLSDLMDTDGTLPKNASNKMAKIAQVYIKLRASRDMARFCDISIKKFPLSTEFSNICILWLLENGPAFLEEENEDISVLCLLKVIINLHDVYSNNTSENSQKLNLPPHFESFKANLNVVSHRLILFSEIPTLRDESLRLFSILFCEHYSQEIDTSEEFEDVNNKLQLFPSDIEQWPYFKSNLFFPICSFLCAHSSGSLPWNSSTIIDSMSRLIFSCDRFSINTFLLKTLCHIYPIIMIDVPNKTTLLLGDELLIILSKYPYSFPKIVTYHVAQLVWILARGCSNVKKQILVEWLKRDDESDILAKAILHCEATGVLLDVITDWKFQDVADRATKMCHKLKNKELSQIIGTMIPAALEDHALLKKLILSNPGIPNDRQKALKVCEFMSLILCFIDDATVLKAACNYSNELVTGLRDETNIVNIFCQDMRNIRFLTLKVENVEEETAVEILRLLKRLVLVQKRNNSVLDDKIEVDLSRSLVGSENKIDKNLDLLEVIVTSRNVFIKLQSTHIRDICTTLFKMSRNSRFALRSFKCLKGILGTNQWLARMNCTNIFIEIQCSLAVDEEAGPEFLDFLIIWMKILHNSSGNSASYDTCYLPDKRTVANYIRRSGFLTQSKEMSLLSRLDGIKLFPEPSSAK